MGLALVTIKTECRIDAWPVYCNDIQRLLAKAVDFSYHSISHTLASLQFLLILVHFIHKLESFHLLLHISIGCQCVSSEYTLNAHVANNILRNTDKLIVPFWTPVPSVGPFALCRTPGTKCNILFCLSDRRLNKGDLISWH